MPPKSVAAPPDDSIGGRVAATNTMQQKEHAMQSTPVAPNFPGAPWNATPWGFSGWNNPWNSTPWSFGQSFPGFGGFPGTGAGFNAPTPWNNFGGWNTPWNPGQNTFWNGSTPWNNWSGANTPNAFGGFHGANGFGGFPGANSFPGANGFGGFPGFGTGFNGVPGFPGFPGVGQGFQGFNPFAFGFPFNGFVPFGFQWNNNGDAKNNGKKGDQPQGFAFPWGFAPFPFPGQNPSQAA